METFSNNAVGTLSAGISDSATSLSVATGEGALWPTLTAGDFCWSTITDGTAVEIIRVTARTGDAFTIVRGQQGTTAQAWSTGAAIELRITRNTLNALRDAQPVLGMQTIADTDFYQASTTGVCPGADDFVVVALAVPYTNRNSAKVHVIAECTNGATGWRLSWLYGQLTLDVFDGSGSLVQCAPSTTVFPYQTKAGELHAIAARIRQVGGLTQISLWVGPAQKAVVTGANPNVSAASGGTLRLGFGTIFDAITLDGGLCGLGYFAGTLTDDVLRAVVGRALLDGEIPTDIVSWTTAWKGSTFFSVAASLTADVGSGTLTRQGTPTALSCHFPR